MRDRAHPVPHLRMAIAPLFYMTIVLYDDMEVLVPQVDAVVASVNW